MIFLKGEFSEMLIISSIEEYLDCLQVGPGMSKPTTYMVVGGSCGMSIFISLSKH